MSVMVQDSLRELIKAIKKHVALPVSKGLYNGEGIFLLSALVAPPLWRLCEENERPANALSLRLNFALDR